MLEGARSVVALGFVYDPGDPERGEGPTARVARYAGGEDYHDVLLDRVRAFETALVALAGHPVRTRGYVDTGLGRQPVTGTASFAIPTDEVDHTPQEMQIDGVPFDPRRGIVLNEKGRVRPGLYAAGWVKRGATGTIGTNKTDADDVANLLVAETKPPSKPGPAGFDALARSHGVRVVSFADWQIINRLEVERATKPAPRRKFVTPAEMIAALDGAAGSRQ